MAHVAHQTICMQYILEASKQLDVDPRACVSSFFARTEVAEANYKQSFEDELNMFKERIRKRAAEKVKDALKEQEEEERQQRLGPGGLDPLDVYQELPDELKKCFDEKDIPLLQETLAKMPSNDAIHYMKRCVDSGLWVPSQSDDDQEDGEKPKSEEMEPAPTTTSTDDVD